MNPIHEIIDATWLEGYTIRVTFSDLRKVVIDLKRYLGRGIFKELTNIEKFKRFRVDAELGTIVWPNGADIAPEVLYQQACQVKQSGRSLYEQRRDRSRFSVKEPVKKLGKKK